MRVERALLEELSEKVFNIGYQGELNHTQVIISCPVMFRDYPDAVASMVVKPPQGDLYPVSLTRDGNDLTWDVSASDVAIPGAGILQLTFTDGEGEEAEIIKTVYGSYSVNASLVANGEAPDPVQSWLDEAGAALATFETEIGDIRKITTATEEDEGLALSPKTVVNGKVTEWEYIDLADPEVVTQAIDDWLDDHPEATTTVEDGAITEAKLNDSLKADLAWQDDVDDVKNALSQSKAPVILDNATGEIVTIPDGADGMAVETLTVAIEPSQDLHGQANPYPGGGGKNLLPLTINGIKALNTTGTWSGNAYTYNGVTYSIQTDDDDNIIGIKTSGTSSPSYSILTIASYTFGANISYTLNGCPNGGAHGTGYSLYIDGEPGGDIGSGYSKTYTSETTKQIRIAAWSANINMNGLTFYPMIRLSSVSDSTFAPYSNLCPISGFSAAEVVRTGKNLVETTEELNVSGSGVVEIVSNYSAIIAKIKKGETYTISRNGTTAIPQCMGFYSAYPSVGATSYNNTREIPNTATFTAPIDGYVLARMATSLYTGYQIEFGSSASAYTPFTGSDTYSITFPTPPGTVYGGTLTVNQDGTGTLVVDRGMETFDGSNDENFTYRTGNGFSITISGAGVVWSSSLSLGMSNYLKANNGDAYAGTGNAFAIDSNSICLFSISGISSVDNLRAYLATNNLQISYPLKTPATYTLTAEAVSLLLGVNNLWADCGNVSMQYPCDTRLFIERLTAPSEDDMIANANITSGKFFMVGNNLFISTSAIAQGETITPGTNCTAVSLADALNAINQ